MDGDPALEAWADENFQDAPLGDARLSRRLVQIAGFLRSNASTSLPKMILAPGVALADAALAGAYRFFSNPRVDPQAVQKPHRKVVAEQGAEHDVVLCVQDFAQFDFSKRSARGSIQGAGPLGKKGGGGQGVVQHAALAVTTDGELLGVLDQQQRTPKPPPPGETRQQRRLRDTAADAWAKAAAAIATLATGACRMVHVGDRHSDLFRFFDMVTKLGHGFLVRARRHRYVAVDDATDAEEVDQIKIDNNVIRLQDALADQPAAGTMTVDVPARSGAPREKRAAREATVALGFVKVTLPRGGAPRNDPRLTQENAMTAWAAQVKDVGALGGGRAGGADSVDAADQRAGDEFGRRFADRRVVSQALDHRGMAQGA